MLDFSRTCAIRTRHLVDSKSTGKGILQWMFLFVLLACTKLLVGARIKDPGHMYIDPDHGALNAHRRFYIHHTSYSNKGEKASWRLLHAKDSSQHGFLLWGRGRIEEAPVSPPSQEAYQRRIFVGYASRRWREWLDEVNREAGTIQVQDRYLDSCQEWAISFAYHFSTFRIWSLFLCFRLPSLRRMAYGILMLLSSAG